MSVTATEPRRPRTPAASRLAALRANAVAALLRARRRVHAMTPDRLSPHDAEVLGALDEAIDAVRGMFDAELAREGSR